MLITVNGKGLCTYSDTCTLCMRKTSRAGQASIAMASQGEAVCVLKNVVRGHHIYKATWTPTVGEILAVRQELGNDHDRHAVCIKVADSHRW